MTCSPSPRRIFPMRRWASPRTIPGPMAGVEVPVWYWQGRAVWGMTARIVRHIVQSL